MLRACSCLIGSTRCDAYYYEARRAQRDYLVVRELRAARRYSIVLFRQAASPAHYFTLNDILTPTPTSLRVSFRLLAARVHTA